MDYVSPLYEWSDEDTQYMKDHPLLSVPEGTTVFFMSAPLKCKHCGHVAHIFNDSGPSTCGEPGCTCPKFPI